MAQVTNTASLSSSSKTGLPRQLTAVGTVGEQNQLFTVYEKNWNCPDCSQENYPSRSELEEFYYKVQLYINVLYFKFGFLKIDLVAFVARSKNLRG